MFRSFSENNAKMLMPALLNWIITAKYGSFSHMWKHIHLFINAFFKDGLLFNIIYKINIENARRMTSLVVSLEQ